MNTEELVRGVTQLRNASTSLSKLARRLSQNPGEETVSDAAGEIQAIAGDIKEQLEIFNTERSTVTAIG